MKIHISPDSGFWLAEIGHDVTGGNKFKQDKVSAGRVAGLNCLPYEIRRGSKATY